MLGIHELFELAAENFHLLVAQDSNPFQISVFLKKLELLFAQAITVPVLRSGTAIKQPANRAMIFR